MAILKAWIMKLIDERYNFLFFIALLIVAAGCTAQKSSTQTYPVCPAGSDCSDTNLTLTVAAYTPVAGDLGWGEVRGKVSDSVNGSPIEGAEIRCQTKSNHPVGLCSGSIKTDIDGNFVFPNVFFNNSDEITLLVSERNHGGTSFFQDFFTHPNLYVNLTLRVIDLTHQPCCTAPACRENESLTCPDECQCGCGSVCVTNTVTPFWMSTQTPSITPTPISYPCIDCSFFWNALSDFCPLAANNDTARALLDTYGEIQLGTLDAHTCLYVVVPGPNISKLYYINQIDSSVSLLYIDPSLLPPTTTTTP